MGDDLKKPIGVPKNQGLPTPMRMITEFGEVSADAILVVEYLVKIDTTMKAVLKELRAAEPPKKRSRRNG